ncbi:uncharacterized protein [Halyomorpha halys]|uniref:uncharacterized protein n=1 Tax=Halyomorpha halys TaxID=286706 RepID=UPI0034D2903C
MKLFLLLLFSTLCASHFCPPRHYWSKSHSKCLECEQCHVTLIPCTAKMNSICANIHEKNHHFQKYRIQFFDDGNEDEFDKQLDSKGFVHKDELYLPHEKEHYKKNMKHPKSKNEGKHHHKLKKHFEFKDDIINDDFNYDSYLDYDSYEKPKKHKKHFEFNKNDKKHDDFLLNDEFENEKHHSSSKGFKKDNHKVSNYKKVNSDEERLEEWLILSKKQLKLRKDDLLKTLKEESGENAFDKKSIRLNSPVYASEKLDVDDKQLRKMEKHLNSGDDINMLKELSKDGKEFESLMVKDTESYRPAKPAHRLFLGEPSTVSEIIGQVKDPQETLRDEMGKNVLYEKPQINVIPFVPSKETQPGGDVVSQPFTAAETLVWDWQAVAVVSAAASCLVFFTVVAIYFVINARQWKKINKNYNKEIEEMSTRIALMHPTMDSANSDSHTTSLYLENITAHGKEDDLKQREQIK